MASDDTPIDKPENPAHSDAPENAVHFYRQGVDTRPRPTGSFLAAFAKYSGLHTLYCQTFDAADYDDFVRRIAQLKQDDLDCRYVRPGDTRSFDDAPLLRIADGSAAPLMWRRRNVGQRRYSIVDEINSLGGVSAHRNLADIIAAPAQPWDALVFPSETIRTTAEERIEAAIDYYGSRFGASTDLSAQRVVIPPGMNAHAFEKSDETQGFREGVRQRLGIGREDFCVLVTGHFAFYQRAHPTPLILALEAAARRTGIRIHLLMAGWFDTARVERSYRDLSRDLAPAVNVIFLDGRDDEIRAGVWFAGDAYAAFHDSVAYGVDMEMLEAMAAGLPVVASDWGSNRDFVSNTEHGYLVPSWLPLAQSGGDLGLAPEREIISGLDERADTFQSGTLSQVTAISIRNAAEAFEVLARDRNHRRDLGAAARKMVIETCDWPIVIRRHQELWADLRRIRGEANEIAKPVAGNAAIPYMDDPFSVFRPFASHVIDQDTIIALQPGLKNGEGAIERLTRVRDNPLNDIAGQVLLPVDEQEGLLRALADVTGMSVLELASHVSDAQRYRVPRTLAWMAKTGLVVLGRSGEEAEVTDRQVGVSQVELGLAARHQGAGADAAAYFESVVHDHPDDVMAHLQLGELRAEENDLDGALEHFSEAVQSDPNSVEAWLDAGKAYVLKGDHSRGIAALQNAVELSPQSAEAMHLLGAAYRRIGNANEAVIWLEKSIRLQPRKVEALLHLGYARKNMGRRAEALQAFRDAMRLAPNSLTARAGELSLGAERRGREVVERDASARRVALHFDSPAGFRALREVFTQLADVHWPLMSSDGRDIVEFSADVIVTTGLQTSRLRRIMPNAQILSAPVFLASQNRFAAAFQDADAVCAPSKLIAESWTSLDLVSAHKTHVTGHPGLDAVFRGDTFAVPPELRHSGAYVLYAPTGALGLSSVDQIGGEPLNAFFGARPDVTLVVKPHPQSIARNEPWIAQWARIAEESERMHVITDPEADLLPYLFSATALITDASSAMFEALAVDKPIILIDPPDAQNTPAFDAQGIEWRWREPATSINDVRELPQAVENVVRMPDANAAVRAQYRDAVFDRIDGMSAAEQVVDLISELST